MYIDDINIPGETDTVEDKLQRFDILKAEANTVRNKDKTILRSLFKNFYNKQLSIGIGFQRAYGSILSGDYFDLIKLPDDNYLFVFADISGHGLPAYTTLIRLRSAVTIAVKRIGRIYKRVGGIDSNFLVRDICTKFTDIMDESNTNDFASVNFTFIYTKQAHTMLLFSHISSKKTKKTKKMPSTFLLTTFFNQIIRIF